MVTVLVVAGDIDGGDAMEASVVVDVGTDDEITHFSPIGSCLMCCIVCGVIVIDCVGCGCGCVCCCVTCCCDCVCGCTGIGVGCIGVITLLPLSALAGIIC